MNRSVRFILGITIAVWWPAVLAPAALAQGQPITIRAARVIDGTGKLLQNATVEVQGSKIAKIDQRSGPVTFNLGDRNLLAIRRALQLLHERKRYTEAAHLLERLQEQDTLSSDLLQLQVLLQDLV